MPNNYWSSEDGKTKITVNKGVPAGLSYSFKQKLDELVDAGIFVDENNDGFTSQEAKALGEEFFNVHKEEGYSTQFKKMKAGTSFDYNDEEFIRLAKAAGYIPKQTEKTEQKEFTMDTDPTKKEVETKTEVKEETVVKASEDKKPEVTDKAEIGSNGVVVADNGKRIANLIIEKLGRNDGDYVIEFEGEEVTDENNNSAGEINVKINGKKYVVTYDDIKGDVTNIKEVQDGTGDTAQASKTESDDVQAKINADSELQGKTLKEQSKVIKKRTSELKKELETLSSSSYETVVDKKGGFLGVGRKTHKVQVSTAYNVSKNATRISEINSQLEELQAMSEYVDSERHKD